MIKAKNARVSMSLPVGLAGMLMSLFLCSFAKGATVTLAWDPPASPGVVGYKLYIGTSSRNYTRISSVGSRLSCRVSGLSKDPYYFAVTALDAAGRESPFSEEVSTEIFASGTSADPIIPVITVSDPDDATQTFVLVTTTDPSASASKGPPQSASQFRYYFPLFYSSEAGFETGP